MSGPKPARPGLGRGWPGRGSGGTDGGVNFRQPVGASCVAGNPGDPRSAAPWPSPGPQWLLEYSALAAPSGRLGADPGQHSCHHREAGVRGSARPGPACAPANGHSLVLAVPSGPPGLREARSPATAATLEQRQAGRHRPSTPHVESVAYLAGARAVRGRPRAAQGCTPGLPTPRAALRERAPR